MEQEKEMALPTIGNGMETLIKLAIEGKADLDKLKELLDLRRESEADEARKMFASSFASAQEKIDAVIKNKMNPQTHSKYADLGEIIKSAKPIYTAEGFSVIFYEGLPTNPAENIRVCADVLHKMGHKETYFYDVPLDGVGLKGNANMTKIHGKSSSVSYGRRYLMCMIWNIPTQDDDGNAAVLTIEYIDDKQKSTIVDNLAALEISEAKFLAFLKVDSLDVLPKDKFTQAMKMIEAKKEQRKKKEKK